MSAPLDTLLDHVRTMILAIPSVQTAEITEDMMVRANSPNRVNGKKAITFVWVPQGRERQFDQEIGRLVICACSTDPVEAESLRGDIVNALDFKARCGTDSLTVWQFDHAGGMATPIHDSSLNVWESEATFTVRYG